MKLLLVDTSPIFRLGLRTAVADASSAGEMTIVGECDDARRASALYAELAADVVVTDLYLKDRTGIALTRELRQADAAAQVLILTQHGPESIVCQAMMAGAVGYALKGQSPAEIVEAIRQVGRGVQVLPPGISPPAPRVAGRSARKGTPQPIDRLSQREQQIFDLVVWGSSNKQIAGRLGISVKTVETHRGHINGKLRVRTSADIVRLASLWGILLPVAQGNADSITPPSMAAFSILRRQPSSPGFGG